ncbi:hypothetical protein SEVIR_2G190600v4 [Setaria viridis]|uniref:non-specific serine/threonine protein kinase n=2 Tax=Setaria viridis TaxID=4556 RepID=A0A4U6VUT8_SETVI|nr:hypothetical protein SEVIR_2G190600v2 [Setaria viridis]
MALAFFVLLLLLAPVVVVSQPGFLSIDCGLDDSYSGYTDKITGIVYVSDGPYIDSGENRRIAPNLESSWLYRQHTLRSFPSGMRNCYALPTVADTKYLVRASFAYGNYDGTNSSSLSFDLRLGPNYWDTVYTDATMNFVIEAIFVAWAGWAPVCLVNTGRGTPFMSALELRQLGDALYPLVVPGLIISTYARENMGSSDSITRYPDDRYDRYWWPMVMASSRWVNESTERTIQPDTNFAVPSPILQTAVAATVNDTALTAITWQYRSSSFMTYLHFADFQDTQIRRFDINTNENQSGPTLKSYSPSYMASSTVYTENYTSTDGNYNITLSASATSVLPPMINALEIYVRVPYESPTTLPEDFDAIMAIKIEYGVKKNWMGDPCFPTKYAWDGVKCSNTSGNTTRITSLDLTNSYLHGAISKNFTLLTALENLDLSHNNLSGSVPDSLLSLPSLRVLNVSGNQLSDNSLCKSYTGSLTFRYDYDVSTCKPSSSPPRNKAIIVVSVVVPVLVVVVLLLAYFIWREKRKRNVQPVSTHDLTTDSQFDNAPSSHEGNQKKSDNRRFTYKELEVLTNNFKKLIGQGGFGPVYYGRLEDDTEVAVKMRSESSSHGLDEFLSEVQSLTKVHHRNLVSLIGYCWEKDHLALVYEYMSHGSLFDHLRGKNDAAEALNWRTRVHVVLEAAQGLDYLHKGCNLPIVHRDVKTSNILMGQKLQAKIGDFGLSKTYLSDTQTHISATAAGTAGYMDPEYYLTGRLTESSDVYSFGVVLLEVATGMPPIVPGHGHIIQRVKQKIATGDIGSIADLQLGSAYDISSMWKVIDTAMTCTADSAAQRPTMATVVIQLKESLALEESREKDSSIRASRGSDIEAMVSTFHPLAR